MTGRQLVSFPSQPAGFCYRSIHEEYPAMEPATHEDWMAESNAEHPVRPRAHDIVLRCPECGMLWLLGETAQQNLEEWARVRAEAVTP